MQFRKLKHTEVSYPRIPTYQVTEAGLNPDHLALDLVLLTAKLLSRSLGHHGSPKSHMSFPSNSQALLVTLEFLFNHHFPLRSTFPRDFQSNLYKLAPHPNSTKVTSMSPLVRSESKTFLKNFLAPYKSRDLTSWRRRFANPLASPILTASLAYQEPPPIC